MASYSFLICLEPGLLPKAILFASQRLQLQGMHLLQGGSHARQARNLAV